MPMLYAKSEGRRIRGEPFQNPAGFDLLRPRRDPITQFASLVDRNFGLVRHAPIPV